MGDAAALAVSGSGDSACEEETCTGLVSSAAGAGRGAASLQEVLAAATKEDGELKLPHAPNGKVRCEYVLLKAFFLCCVKHGPCSNVRHGLGVSSTTRSHECGCNDTTYFTLHTTLLLYVKAGTRLCAGHRHRQIDGIGDRHSDPQRKGAARPQLQQPGRSASAGVVGLRVAAPGAFLQLLGTLQYSPLICLEVSAFHARASVRHAMTACYVNGSHTGLRGRVAAEPSRSSCAVSTHRSQCASSISRVVVAWRCVVCMRRLSEYEY